MMHHSGVFSQPLHVVSVLIIEEEANALVTFFWNLLCNMISCIVFSYIPPFVKVYADSVWLRGGRGCWAMLEADKHILSYCILFYSLLYKEFNILYVTWFRT